MLKCAGFGRGTFQNPLIHALLQACDLLPELVYFVFEILLTTTDAGITGFQNGPETINGLDHGPAQKTCRDV